jgi:hypothetical protein
MILIRKLRRTTESLRRTEERRCFILKARLMRTQTEVSLNQISCSDCAHSRAVTELNQALLGDQTYHRLFDHAPSRASAPSAGRSWTARGRLLCEPSRYASISARSRSMCAWQSSRLENRPLQTLPIWLIAYQPPLMPRRSDSVSLTCRAVTFVMMIVPVFLGNAANARPRVAVKREPWLRHE